VDKSGGGSRAQRKEKIVTSAYEQGTIPLIEVRHRLRIAREAAGMDQETLAGAIGVSRNTISNIEKGNLKQQARKIVINAWALACGVPVGWILTGDNGPPGPDDPNNGLRIKRPYLHAA